MAKTLGVIFGSILVSLPIVYLDFKWGDSFLYKFFREQSISIVATVLALNVATVTFLLGHLTGIELKAEKELFKGTKNEIRDNIYFMAGMAAVIFISCSSINEDQKMKLNSFEFNPLIFLSLIAFILVFVCLFEIVEAIFKATKFIKMDEK